MTAALVAALIAIGGAVVGLVLVVRWGMSAKDGEVSAIRSGSAASEECIRERAAHERTKYELEVTRKALAAANIRAQTLGEELSSALEQSHLGDGLVAGDVPGRLSRIAERWAEAAAARDPLPASEVRAVPAGNDAPASGTSATNVHALTPIDVLR